MNANQKPKRTYRRSVETKQIIFDKAMAIMSEKGFQATTVREICAEANIPIGTFYNCYKSKVDILRMIYDAGDQYMRSALAAAPQGRAPGKTAQLFPSLCALERQHRDRRDAGHLLSLQRVVFAAPSDAVYGRG
jgi:AcrR family transcriptional regulator